MFDVREIPISTKERVMEGAYHMVVYHLVQGGEDRRCKGGLYLLQD